MSIYQHFRKEEYPFIDQVLSWKDVVERSYQTKTTDFLDPREQDIIQMLIGATNDDVQVKLNGGGKYTERKRVIIAPYYEEINEASFQLTLMQATYQSKFISLSHPDVMGAFLSLGLSRPKLGDIFVGEDTIQIIMAEEIAPYIAANLTKIKNATIQLIEKPFSSLMEKEMNWIEAEQTVSSMRLDVIIKEIYKISRKDAANYIAKKQVKVNFKLVEDITFNLLEGDLLSVRGMGRSKLININGKTRKNRLRITTAILK